MDFLSRFFSFLKPSRLTGVLEDTRTPEQKERDYLHEERAISAVANPFGNAKITKSPYPIENQLSTSSCVPHGVGLALAIERKNDTGTYARIAQMFPYRLRSNYPAPGCFPQNIFDIYAKRGAPLYPSLPTPRYEEDANRVIITNQLSNEAEIFKGKEYWMLKYANEITEIAKIAQQGHGVAITVFATFEEYAVTRPRILNPNLKYEQAEVRHEICVLPNSGFTEGGVRYVVAQDSAHFGGKQLRELSEDFIKRRCRIAGYWDTVSTIGTSPRPKKYTFTKTLKAGMSGEEVRQMQLLLIWQGVLPADCATGFFGGRTLAAVRAFQNKYAEDILKPLGLDAPTNAWGSMCIAKANNLYLT